MQDGASYGFVSVGLLTLLLLMYGIVAHFIYLLFCINEDFYMCSQDKHGPNELYLVERLYE